MATKLLPYGVYVLEQTVDKDGFEIKKPILFEITGEENPIQPPILTLNDRPILYRLRLIKTDARTDRVITLAGESFKLKDADGNTVTRRFTTRKSRRSTRSPPMNPAA